MRPRLVLLADRMREQRYRRLFGVLIFALSTVSFLLFLFDDGVAAYLIWAVALLIWFAGRRWWNDPS